MSAITAVIITLNEERNIQRCLDSIVAVVDEIIVVDSFSTDKTAEICSKYPNLQFIQRPWEGYSATKNFGNQQAKHPYILSLDADECLSEELAQNILSTKQSLSGVYRFARLTNYCGTWIHHSGWYPDYKVRLFPKDAAQWQGDFVHEKLTISNTEVKTLSGDILHYSYYSTEEHYERVAKYSLLAAKEKFAKGKKGSLIKGFFSALTRFLKIFFLKKGFMDGAAGFKIAKISAYAAWLRQKKLISLHRESTNSHS
jgi:glycosyltransferase involved in cell wall biosynthesis